MSAFAAVQLAIEDEDHAAVREPPTRARSRPAIPVTCLGGLPTCGPLFPPSPPSTLISFEPADKIARQWLRDGIVTDVAPLRAIVARFLRLSLGRRRSRRRFVAQRQRGARTPIRWSSWARGSRVFARRKCFEKPASLSSCSRRAPAGGRVHTIRSPFAEGLYAEAGAIRIPPQHETSVQLVKRSRPRSRAVRVVQRSCARHVGDVTAQVPDELKKATATLALKPDEARTRRRAALLQRYVGDLPSDMGDPKPSAEAYERWQQLRSGDLARLAAVARRVGGAITLMTLGGDSRELSALYVLRQFALLRNTSQFYKIHGGMDQLPRAMARALGAHRALQRRRRRGSTRGAGVGAVDYLERGRKKTVRASRVILAIPFSTLRQIEIRPPLLGAEGASDRGAAVFSRDAFPASVPQQFLAAAGLSGTARSDQPAEMWDCTYDLAGTRGHPRRDRGRRDRSEHCRHERPRAITFGTGWSRRRFRQLHLVRER